MSNLIYIMGKSSSGKDTICNIIKEKLNFNIYVPYTTRPIRDGEKEGISYNFITDEEYKKLEEQKRVMEKRVYRVKVPDGTALWTYATIDDEQWSKDGDFITVGTLESYNQLKNYFNKDKRKNLIPIYIEIDEEERKKRYIKREAAEKEPNIEEINRRLEADNIDFSEENLVLSGIKENNRFKNYDLDKCIDEILVYIQKEIEKNKSFQERYKVGEIISSNTQIEVKESIELEK